MSTSKEISRLKHRILTDREYEYAESVAKHSLDVCPTCRSQPEYVAPGEYALAYGTYRLNGEEHKCDCDAQKLLYRHYLVAGIPPQFHTLDWNIDYRGAQKVKDAVNHYVENWQSYDQHGFGLTFCSKTQGTGKTFAATWIGKALVKQGVPVYFTNFTSLISIYQENNQSELEHRVKFTPLLILDEVIPPYSEAQRAFFSDKLEDAIRHRTNFNLPTIITTNIEDLVDVYKRTFSLLEPKQLPIKMNGDDFRLGDIDLENKAMVLNGETKPII